MGDINGEGRVSGHGGKARVSFSCSVRSTGMIGLQLAFGSSSDVMVMTTLGFRMMVSHGRRHC